MTSRTPLLVQPSAPLVVRDQGPGAKAEAGPAGPATTGGAPEAAHETRPERASGADRTTRPESAGARAAPSGPTADCEPTLVSKNREPPPHTRLPAAESVTAPDPPPLLPPIPRPRGAESVSTPEPASPFRLPPPPLPPVLRRPAVEPTTAPAPAPPPSPPTPLPLRSLSEATLTPDPTTSLHVARAPSARAPEPAQDGSLTPTGDSIDLSTRHGAPRRGLGRPIAIAVATLVALGVAILLATWLRAGATVTAIDAAAPAPPLPSTLGPLPDDPEVVAPEATGPSTEAPPQDTPTAAPRERRAPPSAPPANKKRHPILGI